MPTEAWRYSCLLINQMKDNLLSSACFFNSISCLFFSRRACRSALSLYRDSQTGFLAASSSPLVANSALIGLISGLNLHSFSSGKGFLGLSLRQDLSMQITDLETYWVFGTHLRFVVLPLFPFSFLKFADCWCQQQVWMYSCHRWLSSFCLGFCFCKGNALHCVQHGFLPE